MSGPISRQGDTLRNLDRKLRSRQYLELSAAYQQSRSNSRTTTPASSIHGSIPGSPILVNTSTTPERLWVSGPADKAAMLEAVYIFDITGRILLNFPIKNAPSIASLVPTVVGPDYDLKDPSFVEVSASQLLYRHPYRRMVIVIPCGPSTPPLLVQEFVKSLIRDLELYFEEDLSQSVLEANSSIIVALLDQMVDAGLPSIMEPDVLRELVHRNTIVDKLLSAIGPVSTTPAWEYSWRRPGVKYAHDELFVDVIEHLTLLVGGKRQSKKMATRLGSSGSAFYSTNSVVVSKPTICRIRGEIKIISKLSGVPQVQLDVVIPGVKDGSVVPAFHRAVDLSLWNSQKLITFVPPDGASIIGEYTIDSSDQGIVFAELRRDLGDERSEFEIRISTNMDTQVKAIDNLVITVTCPSATKSIKEIRTTSGEFNGSNPTRAAWTFSEKVPVGWSATFRGQAIGEKGPLQPQYVTVTYDLTGRIPSQTSVKSVSIINWKNKPKNAPYKGVRYQTKVDSFVLR